MAEVKNPGSFADFEAQLPEELAYSEALSLYTTELTAYKEALDFPEGEVVRGLGNVSLSQENFDITV